MPSLRKPEWGLLLALLLFVAGLAGAGWQVREQRRVHRLIIEDSLRLIQAVRAYSARYQRMPSHFSGYYDMNYGTRSMYPNRQVLNVLQARDAIGNLRHVLNPDQTVFITNQVVRARHSGVNHLGDWVDPWHQPYRIILDTDNDRICNPTDTVHHENPAVGLRAVLWSCGPDRRPDTGDDLLGWSLLYRYGKLGQ